MEIFTQTGGEFLSRWGHYLSGVTWIGLLYYFNFVQVPSFAQFEAGPRTESISKLVPRALWWFRWAAVLTVLTGLSILAFQERLNDMDFYKSAPGISISTGILFALTMFANVWMVIWPKQRIVIASAQGVQAGREADPAAAGAGRKALLASRTNVVLSIPMLFFMAFTSHFSGAFESSPEGSDRALYWAVVVVTLLLVELNGLGLIAGTGQTAVKKYLETHRASIIAGFVIAAICYVMFEVAFGG
ncbi:MAG TPA: urate hydroxylase PuuD [Acidimicrobiales bacterium]|nr:urate hydroxylase PuuD [Acidimicrobiales bacterium]